MTYGKSAIAALLLLAAVGLSACGNSASPAIHPSARLERVAGSSATRIVLSALGAQRIGIQTASVRSATGSQVIVPYSSIVYGAGGSTYTFTNPSPLVYMEVLVKVDHFAGSSAYLRTGPPVGARVVTVGAEELLGVQTGVLAQT